MTYLLEQGIWSSVFAVPREIVDKHIKLCPPLSLRILMVILSEGNVDTERLSALLGQSQADIQDALGYWINHGVIKDDMAPVHAEPAVSEPVVTPRQIPSERVGKIEPTESDERKIVSISRSRPRLTTDEINGMVKIDQSIGHMIQETQGIMKKPLSPLVTEMLVGLYSYYGMQPDLILMLVQYCVSMGKDSVRYIEKVAASWMEQGIDTHEKAEAEILRATQRKKIENRVKSAFGIYDRSLIASEQKFIETWVNDYRMDLPLIELAYERSVEIKGKLSFAYINGILTNWYNGGISTPMQAMKEIGGRKEAAASGREKIRAASYELSELESKIAHGDLSK